jgi:hypothetical protein
MITVRFIEYLVELYKEVGEGRLPNPLKYKDLVAISNSATAYKIIHYLSSNGIMTKTEKGYLIDLDKMEKHVINLIDAYRKGKL